jgi:hypothetical protein
MVDGMTGPGQLVLRVIVLVAMLVGGIVATALTHAWWVLVVTVAALVAAAAAIAISVNAMLGEDERIESAERRRGPVVALGAGAVALVTVALVVALPVEDSAAVSTTARDAPAATATVRAFLASAVLDGNAYAACQYLAPSEQQQVARAAGEGQTCRDALTAAEPSIPGVYSEGALHALSLHGVVRGTTAFVTGRSPLAFELKPATAAETSAYAAPPAAWRIVSGATAVLTR